MAPLYYGKQWIDQTDVRVVGDVLHEDFITQGPRVAEFEAALADYCGARHAVAVCNGSAALHLACLAADIGPGDEGVTTSNTFLASAACLVHCGATPRFADIAQDTWNLDATQVEHEIHAATRVLIPVHFAGLPCDMAGLRRVADRHGLLVIEDACHALGATYNGHRVGACAHSDMCVFSFHPVKHITTGEGGAILTNRDDLAERLRRLRHHGIVAPDPSSHASWEYEVHQLGFNARLTAFQAALGTSQLRRLDAFLQRRRTLAERYRDALQRIEGLRYQQAPSTMEHAYHLFVIHLDPARYNRSKVFHALRDAGVVPQVHYPPVHRQPAFRRFNPNANLPETEAYYAGCLSLPLYPKLSDEDHAFVIRTLVSVLESASSPKRGA